MIGVLCLHDDSKGFTKKDIYFINILSSEVKDIEIEAKPFALAFARKVKRKKVYLFYGEKGKIVYDFAL